MPSGPADIRGGTTPGGIYLFQQQPEDQSGQHDPSCWPTDPMGPAHIPPQWPGVGHLPTCGAIGRKKAGPRREWGTLINQVLLPESYSSPYSLRHRPGDSRVSDEQGLPPARPPHSSRPSFRLPQVLHLEDKDANLAFEAEQSHGEGQTASPDKGCAAAARTSIRTPGARGVVPSLTAFVTNPAGLSAGPEPCDFSGESASLCLTR